MKGLYPEPATAPGWNLASGKPFGPGTAIRVGLKSGAPWKWTSACPKGFCAGVGESRVTVCTQAGQLIPILAKLGAYFSPRLSTRPSFRENQRTKQAVLPKPPPFYNWKG